MRHFTVTAALNVSFTVVKNYVFVMALVILAIYIFYYKTVFVTFLKCKKLTKT